MILGLSWSQHKLWESKTKPPIRSGLLSAVGRACDWESVALAQPDARVVCCVHHGEGGWGGGVSHFNTKKLMISS